MRLSPPSFSALFLGLATLALPLLGAGDASADIFKSVDADGVVHFTNTRAQGGQLYAKDHKSRANVVPIMPSDTSIERFSRYDEWIRQAATLYQLPEELVRAVIMAESNYDPRALSPAGAIGLMQLMPETAQRMEAKDPHDPRENIFGGTRYLRILANLFNGDLELTIAGYNAGEGAVIRHGGIPPYAETQDYVVKVLTYYRRYRATRDATAASVGSVELDRFRGLSFGFKTSAGADGSPARAIRPRIGSSNSAARTSSSAHASRSWATSDLPRRRAR